MKNILLILLVFCSVQSFSQDTMLLKNGKKRTLSIPNRTYQGNVSGALSNPDTLNYAVFNVKDFGLKDDSTTDNTAAFRALLAQVPDGARIYFPGGGLGYLFTDSILINKNVVIYGDGKSFFKVYTINNVPQKGATNLYFNAGNKNFFCLHSSAANKNPIVYIRDLTLQSTSASTPTTSNGIIIYDGVGNHMFNSITVAGFYNDVNCVSGNNLSLSFCDILSPIQDAIILGNTAEPDYGDWNITHCKIYSGLSATTVARGIYVKGGGTINISDNFFNAQATLTINTGFIYPIYTDFSQALTSEIKIANNFFDNYQTNGIRMRNYSGTRIWNTILTGNQFAPLYNNAGTLAGIDVVGFDHMIIDDITGVQVSSTSYPVVKLDSCDNVTLGAIVYHGYNAEYSATANCTNLRRFANSDSIWNRFGNPATSGSSFLGTTNNISLRMRTNNVERMVIDSSTGRIGFGIAVPANSFDFRRPVGQDANLNLTTADNTSSFGYSGVNMSNQSNTLSASLFYGNGSSAFPNQFWLTTRNSTAPLILGTNNLTARVYIDNNGGVSIGAGAASANASSLVEIASTTKGFLPPRMTQTQRDAISSPATGLQLYNTVTNETDTYNGTNWNEFVISSAGTLTLKYGGDYIFTGTTATWTVPSVVGALQGRQNAIYIKNRGSGAITLSSATTLYTTSAQGTINIAAGAACMLLPDGTYFNVMYNL